MLSAAEVILAVLLVILSYFSYVYTNKFRKARICLSWVPQGRRLPIVGSLMDFHGSSELLNDLNRMTDNPQKLFYVESPNLWAIMCRNYDLAEFVLSSNSIIKKSFIYELFHEWLGTGLLTSAGEKWKKRRRIITPAYHFSILEQFIETFDNNANILVQKLKDKEIVDIYSYVNLCALDTICESAMGVKIDSQNKKNQEYVYAVKDYCRIVSKRALSSWRRIQALFRFTDDYATQKKHIRILHGFSNSVVEKRKEEFIHKPANEALETDNLGRKRKLVFLDVLLTATIDGKPLRQEDIREEVDTFIFEGHDTTSSAISSALFLLANHTNIQQLVRREMKKIFGNNRDKPTSQRDLQDMKYLELVIKETLRLYPPVPTIARHVEQDIEFKGKKIPKDTLLNVFIYGINRDPDFFESPDVFKPDRFLNMTSKYPYSYIPFSAGPRNCIGQKFAMLEIKCIISKIIKNFVLLPTDPPHEMVMVSEAVLKSMNGVKVKIKKVDWDENM